jgi:hypothetical protein
VFLIEHLKIVDEEEEKVGLSINSISLDTIRSREKRGNPEAYTKNKLLPIRDLEPTICDFFMHPGKRGCPLTKTSVIEVANNLIRDMSSRAKL